MTPDLTCYGDQIRGVADLVGDFDLRSPMDVHAWYRVEWQAIAELLGFSQELEATLAPLRVARDRVTATNQAGVDAFARWLRGQRSGLSDSHARTQEAVLAQLVAAGDAQGEMWRVTADPTTLTAGACYDDGGQLRRAFYPDTAPGYFGDGWSGPPPRAESACGWTTPLVLHLGTFPWVYSSRLDGPAVGARWASTSTAPALTGMRAMARLLEPGGNLRQDARQVAAIYEHFATHTAPLVARLPVYQPGRAAAGQLYRRAGFLYVHQGSLHLAGLSGPRGRIAAPAYNYALRRFACFFAVRRAALRALVALPSDVQRIAENSADPCLRRQLWRDWFTALYTSVMDQGHGDWLLAYLAREVHGEWRLGANASGTLRAYATDLTTVPLVTRGTFQDGALATPRSRTSCMYSDLVLKGQPRTQSGLYAKKWSRDPKTGEYVAPPLFAQTRGAGYACFPWPPGELLLSKYRRADDAIALPAIRAVAQLQRRRLSRSLDCAYVRPDAVGDKPAYAAFRDASLRAHCIEMRKRLLQHPARMSVEYETAREVDPEYASALKDAGVPTNAIQRATAKFGLRGTGAEPLDPKAPAPDRPVPPQGGLAFDPDPEPNRGGPRWLGPAVLGGAALATTIAVAVGVARSRRTNVR